ncbi:MAG: FtsH-binding integral membrane protein, partial [Cyclobacteriaceae bacterium]
MRNLSFYTSKKKLLKKTVFPAIAVFLLWFFVVVPDDDIGAGTDFFGFMTFILFAGIIGLLVFLFYQIKVIQKIPVLIITKSELILPRKKLRISLTKDLVFTASKIEGQEPPSEAIDIPFGIDLLVDRKDYFLYAWQNNKRIKDIYITYLNLDENIIAALLNDLIEKEENDREALIITFYEILLQKFGEKISNRLILSNQNEELKTTVFQEIREDNLEGISLKKEYKILSTIAAFFWIIYTLIAPSPFILFFSSIISAALYGLLFALIPYKKLKFKKKYPLGILSAWIFTAMVGLVIHISPFSTQTSYCDLPEIKTALKNAMVLDMRDWQRN